MVRGVRRIAMGAVLAAIFLLAALSVVGAFLGAERAKALFNSVPLAVFWFLVAGLLLAGFIFFRNLIRSPGLLAMHLGPLLVLAGAMYGSDAGHEVAARLLGERRIPFGYMVLYEEQSSDVIFDPKTGRPIGLLPFEVRLDDFRVEYYGPWLLGIEPPTIPGHPMDHSVIRVVDWKVGEEVVLPNTGVRVRVLQYLPNAEPVCEDDGTLAGAEPGPTGCPPAMEVLLAWRGREQRAWLVVPEGEPYVSISMGPLFGVPEGREGRFAPRLYLLEPEGPVKDYVSDVTVLADGEEAARKAVEVNHPLHFGGYHFCQHDYDHDQKRYTVLAVRSDQGLRMVYAGFILLVGGVCARFWGQPVWRQLTGRSERGS